MWHNNILSDKTWAGFKNLFMEQYNDLRELQPILKNQTGFHGANMAITMQDNIVKALENLAMTTTSDKYVLTPLTSNIKQLEENNRNLMEKIQNLTAKNACLTSDGGHQQKIG